MRTHSSGAAAIAASHAASASYSACSPADERPQALVLLAASRAAGEMRAQAGNSRVRIGAGKLELDVAVELLEALVAADLGLGRSTAVARSTSRRVRGRVSSVDGR